MPTKSDPSDVGDALRLPAGFQPIRRSLPETPRGCVALLNDLLASPGPVAGSAASLRFAVGDGRDVYNITAPFPFAGQTLIAGRVEPRDSEQSETVLFRQAADGQWVPHHTDERFRGLQDPCVTLVDGDLVLGGVRYPVLFADGPPGCQMEFYRGSSLAALEHILTGPPRMKDLRLKGLPDGRVAVFSRPQGAIGGRGTIGFTIADGWAAVTADLVAAAPLFHGQFAAGEWGGANEAHLLDGGLVGVLGHVARFDAEEVENRHYYPMAFVVDPRTGRATPPVAIAHRGYFPAGPAKRPDLVDVVFSGGLVRHRDGTASLYAGTSDAAAAVVRIPDPFASFE